MKTKFGFNVALVFCIIVTVQCVRKYTKNDLNRLREEVKEMFRHAYDSYLIHAYPYDELRPLSCDGIDTWGSYSLTLIDALDTLAIMGNYTEFKRVVNLITKKENFDANINVSVFETNIRIIGGLLSAHLLSHRAGLELEPGWPCNGPLLRLAEDVAQRLIVAFDTMTGMPYGTVNLRSGVPRGETSITCTAGIGTFIIEFGTLSRLTGDPLYEEVAMHALKALYNHRSLIGLVGNHIDVLSGRWTAQDAGIGGGVDSYYEYLVKGSILLQKPELRHMFNEGRKVIDKYLKKEDWYVWASMSKGQVTLPVFQSLEAYWPGVLTLIGETDTAMKIIHNYHSVWKQYGFTPEVYNIAMGEASPGRESYPLRPELVESLMYLYRETRDPILLQMGEDILRSIQHSARTPCGYATIKYVRDHRKEDRMESFFLAETTKYLYLLFDPDNFIHNPGTHGTVIDTPSGECVVDVGGYIFNTEAHPIDPAMLDCCYNVGRGLDLNEIDRMSKFLEDEDKLKLKNMNVSTSITIDLVNDDLSLKEGPKSAENLLKEVFVLGLDDIFKVAKEKSKLAKTGDTMSVVEELTEDTSNLSDDNAVTGQNEPISSDILEPGLAADPVAVTAEDFKTYSQNPVSNSDENLQTETENDNRLKSIAKPKVEKQIRRNITLAIPTFVQDFIANSIPAKAKCEPQQLLERIRNNKVYDKFAATTDYQLLLTPAPTFLQRISLAGEFVFIQNKL